MNILSRILGKRMKTPLPPSDQHLVLAAAKVVEAVQGGAKLRFVDSAYDPGAYHPKLVNGYWPLITGASIVQDLDDRDVVALALEGQDVGSMTHGVYANLDEDLTLAPGGTA